MALNQETAQSKESLMQLHSVSQLS